MLFRLNERIERGERDAGRVCVRAGEWGPAAGLSDAHRALSSLVGRERVCKRRGSGEEPSRERLLEAVHRLEQETILQVVQLAQFAQVPN